MKTRFDASASSRIATTSAKATADRRRDIEAVLAARGRSSLLLDPVYRAREWRD